MNSNVKNVETSLNPSAFGAPGEDKGPCPSCGSEESEKQLSAFSSVTSGSGLGLGSSSASSSCASHGGFS